jgi:hypothetical protein
MAGMYKPDSSGSGEGKGFSEPGNEISASITIQSQWRTSDFSLTQSFRPHYGPGVDSASDRNEYQGSSLESKGDRRVGLTTLPPSYTDSFKNLAASASWSPWGISRPAKI